MHPELQLVVLDMSGTTVRDRGEVPRAFTAALAAHGISLSAEQLNAVRGASKREAVLSFVPQGPGRTERAQTIYVEFQSALERIYASEGVEPVAGAAEAFAELRGAGVRVALNTGFDRDIVQQLLRALRWEAGVVDAVVCGDDVERGRPAPDLILRAMELTAVCDAQGVMNVGDTTLDLQAGRAAGVRWNVGVLSGAHSRVQLLQAPHTHVVRSILDLLSV